MAMALAARGDFFATSAVAGDGVAVVLTAAVLAGEAAVLPEEFLVALVTDGVAVFAVVGFLAEGGVLTGVLDTWPCRTAVEDVFTAFLTGTTFLPAGELAGLDLPLTAAGVGFFATGFLTGAAFLAGMAFLATGFLAATFLAATTGFFTATGFLAGTAFLATGFLAAAFLAATTGFFTATGFLAGTAFLTTGFGAVPGFLATAFFTKGLADGAAFLTAAFLAGALALVFDLALALALCWVDFTAHLLSAGPGESIETPRLLLFFYIFAILFMPAGVFTCRPLARGLYSA
jgi:hypothetical protein